MPRVAPEQIEFRYDQWQPVLDRMDDLSRAGRGWINLYPGVADDDVPETQDDALFAGLIQGRGPSVPMGTWLPESPRKVASVGLVHGLKAKAVRALRDAGVPVPDGWRVEQDHVRRGLVVRPPAGTEADAILAWLMAAVDALCPVALTGSWLAEVHRG